MNYICVWGILASITGIAIMFSVIKHKKSVSSIKNGTYLIFSILMICLGITTIIFKREHLGMLSNPAYKESWDKKLAFYKSIGFEEGTNLFTTIDHENGSIDSDEIKEVLQTIEDLL